MGRFVKKFIIMYTVVGISCNVMSVIINSGEVAIEFRFGIKIGLPKQGQRYRISI